MTKYNDIEVYVTKPADYPHSPSKLLLLLTGGTGVHSTNNQLQADKYAQEGFLVVMPDQYVLTSIPPHTHPSALTIPAPQILLRPSPHNDNNHRPDRTQRQPPRASQTRHLLRRQELHNRHVARAAHAGKSPPDPAQGAREREGGVCGRRRERRRGLCSGVLFWREVCRAARE